MIEVQYYRDQRSGCSSAQKDVLLSYMRKGKVLCASPSIKKDCVTGENLPIYDYYQTDGEYIWSSEVLYYLDKYDFNVTNDFKQHVLN